MVWLGAERELLVTPAHLERIDAAVGHWQNEIVSPIRAVRQRIKGLSLPGLYDQIKTLELTLKRTEQSMLFALASTFEKEKIERREAITANATLYAANRGGPPPDALIKAAISRL